MHTWETTIQGTPRQSGGTTPAAENTRLRTEVTELETRLWHAQQEVRCRMEQLDKERRKSLELSALCDQLQEEIKAMRAARGHLRASGLGDEELWDSIEHLEVENARLSCELAQSRADLQARRWAGEQAPAAASERRPPVTALPATPLPRTHGRVFCETLFALIGARGGV